jgi:DNA polymerase
MRPETENSPMQHALKLDDEKPPKPATHSSTVVDYDYPADIKTWNGIALVGEAPGADEVRLGHPFVGRSGQLLDKILTEAGIDRKQSLVANVFRMQPPANKVDHFFISARASKLQGIGIAEEYGRFGSAYCRAEFAPHIEHLQTTLKKLKPHIIVALGRTPLWALTGEDGLLKKVGMRLPCRLAPGIEVIPTFHPSFILRGNWGLQGEWLKHFAAAKTFMS